MVWRYRLIVDIETSDLQAMGRVIEEIAERYYVRWAEMDEVKR